MAVTPTNWPNLHFAAATEYPMMMLMRAMRGMGIELCKVLNKRETVTGWSRPLEH